MPDVTVLGGGAIARACGDVLTQAGLHIHRTFELESNDRGPLIVGEVPGSLRLARQAVGQGRHVLVAFSGGSRRRCLEPLLSARVQGQALCFWSERRYLSPYLELARLQSEDARWRPQYLRQQTLTTAPPGSDEGEACLSEGLALLITLAGSEAADCLWAERVRRSLQHGPDAVSVGLAFRGVTAHLEVGTGELFERRETLLVSAAGKAFVDELALARPLRLADLEAGPMLGDIPPLRGLRCGAGRRDDTVLTQCRAFLDLTTAACAAEREARLWSHVLTCLQAMGGCAARVTTLGSLQPRHVYGLTEGAGLFPVA
jgi:hypothetical protein